MVRTSYVTFAYRTTTRHALGREKKKKNGEIITYESAWFLALGNLCMILRFTFQLVHNSTIVLGTIRVYTTHIHTKRTCTYTCTCTVKCRKFPFTRRFFWNRARRGFPNKKKKSKSGLSNRNTQPFSFITIKYAIRSRSKYIHGEHHKCLLRQIPTQYVIYSPM